MGGAPAGGQLLNLPPAGSREQPCTLVELRARLPPSHQRATGRGGWGGRGAVGLEPEALALAPLRHGGFIHHEA